MPRSGLSAVHFRRPPSRLGRFLVALGVVAAATAGRQAVDPLIGNQIPYFIYVAAVVVATLFAGVGGGILSTVTAAFAGNYLFVPPRYEFVPHGDDLIAMGLFSAVSLGLVAIVGRWRRAEQEVRGLHQKTSAVLEQMPVGVMVVESSGAIDFRNSTFDRLLGMPSHGDLTLAEFRDEREYATFRFLDGREIPTDERPLTRALRGETTRDDEIRVLRKDGTRCVVSASAAPVRADDGAIVGAVLAVTDISDRRRIEAELLQREEQLRAATLAAEVGVWTWTPETNRVTVGANWRGLFGVAPDVEVTFETWANALHPDDRQRAVDTLHAAWRERHDFASEYRIDAPDGAVRWIVDRGRAFSDANGVVSGMAGINLDITKLKDAEIALREANHVKDEFLATLSHELRTPLNAIIGWSSMLLKGSLTGEVTRRAYEAIARNAAAQHALIEDVLDVSRIVSGRFRLESGQTDVAVPLCVAIDTVRPLAEEKDIAIESVLAEEPTGVWGDSNRLQQVFLNLLSNAVKFTGNGGRIRVQLDRVGSEVRVQVSDNGVGMPPDLLPHVFERFRQADSSSTRTHNGLGLGLAIVRHLVELHGGTVEAASEGEGRGATFTVRLPFQSLRECRRGDVHAGSRDVLSISPVDTPSLCGVRVFVVDDQADSREVAASVLRLSGATVETADSAKDALDRLEAVAADVLLVDVAMPVMDGIALIRAIREGTGRAALTPAIAFTAYARAEDRRLALASGFQMHLAKPVDAAGLVRAVAAVLERGRGSPFSG